MVAITKTITLTNWRDGESGTTGNPMAEASILAMARAKELLVEDDGHMFAPVEQQGRWRARGNRPTFPTSENVR